jgi:membrane associated rhomboid family serine protease
MGIVNDIKQTFKQGSITTRLIYINLSVFLLIRIISVLLYVFKIDNNLLVWLALPSDVTSLLLRPWTLITYMFLHYDFIHILFNLLWFYWFSKIFLIYFDEQKLLGTYFMGGIIGGLFYVLAFNFFPAFEGIVNQGILLGASASIMAIVVATALYVPNLEVNLLLISSIFGPIKIIWIALVSVIIYFIGITGTNAGGNLAHLGGALWGFIYMWQLKKGHDLTLGFNRFIYSFNTWFIRRRRLIVSHRNQERPMSDWDYNRIKKAEKAEMNEILDKIGKSGYDSLTKAEKELLFRMGGRNGKPN